LSVEEVFLIVTILSVTANSSDYSRTYPIYTELILLMWCIGPYLITWQFA